MALCVAIICNAKRWAKRPTGPMEFTFNETSRSPLKVPARKALYGKVNKATVMGGRRSQQYFLMDCCRVLPIRTKMRF